MKVKEKEEKVGGRGLHQVGGRDQVPGVLWPPDLLATVAFPAGMLVQRHVVVPTEVAALPGVPFRAPHTFAKQSIASEALLSTEPLALVRPLLTPAELFSSLQGRRGDDRSTVE